jgi:hypothetical protein
MNVKLTACARSAEMTRASRVSTSLRIPSRSKALPLDSLFRTPSTFAFVISDSIWRVELLGAESVVLCSVVSGGGKNLLSRISVRVILLIVACAPV